jgi:hypothetical protein
VVLTLNPDSSLYYNGKLVMADANGNVLNLFFSNTNISASPSYVLQTPNILCKVLSAVVYNDKMGITT